MLSKNTTEHYERTYNMIVKKALSNKLSDLYNYIKKADVKDNTKLSYLNSIISLKKHDESRIKGNLTKITKYRDDLNTDIEKQRNKNNITDNQKKAVDTVSYEDLIKYKDELKEIKNKNVKSLENYLLIALMLLFPLRNDLQDIKFTNKKIDIRKDNNIIYIPKKGNLTLYLKQYKTSRTQGELVLEIPEELSNDIRHLIKIDSNRKYLFETIKNEPYTSSAFTHKLNALLKKKFNIKIGSTLIRKIYLTSKYSNVLKEMKDDSKVMGHSTQTAQNIYIDNQK